MADVQYYDGSTWVTIPEARWRVENGVSSKMPAPRASVDVGANTDLTPNTDVRIVEGSDVIFDGFSRTGGEYGESGSQRIELRADAWKLLDEAVTLDLANTTDEQVVSAALAATEFGGNYTLSYPETPIDVGDYAVDGREFQVILRDMMDRSGRVWWFDAADDTLHVQSLGYRGEFAQLETERDGISVQTWNEGDIATVQNDVTVKGTGSNPVSASREDTASISDYGRHSETYSYRWLTDATQAGDLADALLIPDPLQNGKVLVSDRAVTADTHANLSNYSITLTDDARGIQSVIAGIEKQVIQEGRTTLQVGRGSGYAESSVNRDTQSAQDAVRENFRQMNGTLDDIDDGNDYGKIFADAIQNGYHTLSAAVGDLDNINDGGTYARVRSGNVDADNYVLLATSRGDLDDIDDGSNYGKVLTTALDAGNIILAEAVGDLDDIDDGTDFGKVAITNLTPGGAVFATGVELDDGRSLDDITTEDAAKADATVIDGGDILTNSLTADEISTLDLETQDISIGHDPGSDGTLEFDLYTFPDGTELPRFYPSADGYGELGRSGNWWSNLYVNTITATDISCSTIESSGEFSALAGTMEIFGEWRSSDADYDFIISENPMSGKTGPAIYPDTDSRAEVGTGDGTNSDKAIGSVHTVNLYQYTPAPLSPDDPRIETPADGGHPVDLDELQASTWMDPPEYAAQGKDPETGEYRKNPEREDGTRGVELGHMTNYLFETAKRLAAERDALQERVDKLESRLDRIEAQLD